MELTSRNIKKVPYYNSRYVDTGEIVENFVSKRSVVQQVNLKLHVGLDSCNKVLEMQFQTAKYVLLPVVGSTKRVVISPADGFMLVMLTKLLETP